MSEFLQALTAYQTLDPAGWVALYRYLPLYAGLVCVGVGSVLLLFGGGRAFRVVAGPLGLAVGLVLTAPLLGRLGMAQVDPRLPAVVGLGLLVLCVAFPPTALFVAVGVPVGMLCGQLMGSGEYLVGFGPGFLLAGVAAVLAHRALSVVAASLVGAWVLVLGLLATLDPLGGMVASIVRQPWGVLLAGALFALAGSVYQLAVRRTPEEAAQLKMDKLRAKQRLAEKRALEKRWGSGAG
jgi:hypothetical protein